MASAPKKRAATTGSPSLPKYKLYEVEKALSLALLFPKERRPRPHPQPRGRGFLLVIRGNSEHQSRRNTLAARILCAVAFSPHTQPIDLSKTSLLAQVTRHRGMRAMLQRIAPRGSSQRTERGIWNPFVSPLYTYQLIHQYYYQKTQIAGRSECKQARNGGAAPIG